MKGNQSLAQSQKPVSFPELFHTTEDTNLEFPTVSKHLRNQHWVSKSLLQNTQDTRSFKASVTRHGRCELVVSKPRQITANRHTRLKIRARSFKGSAPKHVRYEPAVSKALLQNTEDTNPWFQRL